MLPEFADVGSPEAPVGALLGQGGGNQVRKFAFDIGFDGCAGSFEVAQPLHFVGNELIVGRALDGQDALEEIEDFGRPILTSVTAAGRRLIAGFVFEVVRAQLIDTRATYAQAGGGTCRVNCAGVEILENDADKIGRQAMDKLFLCTPGSIDSIVRLRQSFIMGALPPTPRSFPHWANGLSVESVAARMKPCRDTEA